MNEYQRTDRDADELTSGYDAAGAAMGGGDFEDRGAGQSPEEIEREIERTRGRMSRDIDAIGEKLSPRNLASEAQTKISDAAQNAGRSLLDVLRDNPLPAAAVGASVAWLVASARSSSGSEQGYGRRYGGYYAGGERRFAGSAGGFGSYGSYGSSYRGGGYEGEFDEEGTLQRAKHAVSDTASEVADKAGELKDRAADTAHHLGDRASDVASRAGDRASDLASDARYRLRRFGDRAQETLRRQTHENPLMVAAGAAVLGLALGLILPATRKENELMGHARDQVVDRAEETAERVKDTAVEQVQQVADTVKSSVQEHKQDLKEVAKDVGQQVKGQVKDSAAEVKQEAKDAARGKTDTGGQATV